jgi:hypothetical protein
MARMVVKALRMGFAVLGLMAVVALATEPVNAAVITVTTPGYNAAPSTLGGYNMTAFGQSVGPANTSNVTTVTDLGVTVGFDKPLWQAAVGNGWATWSHGYTGSVWHTAFGLNPADRDAVALYLPAGTKAFYLYAMPNGAAGIFNMTYTTLQAPDGGFVTQAVDISSGAHYFGAYVTDSSTLTHIVLTSPTGSNGFAIGEFGISFGGGGGSVVPEPTSMAIFGLSGLAFLVRRRTASKKL